jgi:predicted transcriptional regulator
LSQKVAENFPVELLLKIVGVQLETLATTPATIQGTTPAVQQVDETGFGECCEHHEPITSKQGFKKKISDEMILKAFEGKGISKEKFNVLTTQKVGFSENPIVGEFAELNLTSLQQLILEELKKNPKLTKSELAEKANTNLFEIDDNLKALTEVGAIEEKTRVVRGEEVIERKVTETGKTSIQNRPEIVKYKILYSYEERPGIPAAVSGSRPLCKRLFESKLYFTGSEIQDISDQLGYSVFLLCGGWYTNPDTKKSTPYCRHFWQKNVVVEK